MSHTWLVSRHAARPRVASRSARAPRRRLSQTPSTATESTRSYERALIESGPATRWTGAVELAGRVSSTRVDSRDTGIRGRRQNSYRTESELILWTTPAISTADFLQYSHGFSFGRVSRDTGGSNPPCSCSQSSE